MVTAWGLPESKAVASFTTWSVLALKGVSWCRASRQGTGDRHSRGWLLGRRRRSCLGHGCRQQIVSNGQGVVSACREPVRLSCVVVYCLTMTRTRTDSGTVVKNEQQVTGIPHLQRSR